MAKLQIFAEALSLNPASLHHFRMNPPQFASAFCAVMALVATAVQPARAESFSKKHLNSDFWAEGAAVGDFNKDGIPDVAYGPFWYEGPDFKKERAFAPATATWQLTKPDGAVEARPGFMGAKSPKNGYSDNFLTFSEDFNKDGWDDILVVGFPGKEAFWYENPRGADIPWTRHLALPSVDNESPGWLTVTKDGRKGLVCSTGGVLGFGLPVEGKPAEPWVWHPISPKGPWQKFTHGLGMGDINGDGRPDLLEARGWWEQPASLEGNPEWVFHEALFGSGGAQMLVTDVNGDGLPDVITSLQAHGYGIVWFEQTRESGVPGWKKHTIVGDKPDQTPHGTVFSQPHALALADLNGDGLPDLVCGKRFWAHGPSGDPEPNAPAVLYWFELKREAKKASFVPHLIDDDSGVGTQVTVAPLGPARKLGIVVGNKKGLFTFER
jgi:hypothetical protein